MGNNTWKNLLDPHPTARGAAKNTFTTYQDVASAVNGTLPMSGANELKLGTRVEIEAWGDFSTTATPTLQLGAIYNATPGAAAGTAIAQSAAITTASGAAAFPWHYHVGGIVTALGTSGVIYMHGVLDLGTSLTAFAASACPVTAAARSVTINTTISAFWGLGAAYGASSASNGVTVDVFNVFIVNQGKT